MKLYNPRAYNSEVNGTSEYIKAFKIRKAKCPRSYVIETIHDTALELSRDCKTRGESVMTYKLDYDEL